MNCSGIFQWVLLKKKLEWSDHLQTSPKGSSTQIADGGLINSAY